MRWKQRFENFSKAYGHLSYAVQESERRELSALEQEGLVTRFQFTFELGWKVFKDYLYYIGAHSEGSPRAVIRECARIGIFDSAGIDAEEYLNMMLERNNLAHTYDFDRFSGAIQRIKNKYLNQLGLQHEFFALKEL